ncbi:MAG: terminase small subunit [Ruminococcus sp.]
MKKLTKKEKAFCRGFLEKGSIAEAESYAGISKGGSELICRDDILEEIERLSQLQNKSLKQRARSGLMRLAMGNIADAVSLISMKDYDSEKLKNMDLFMVSEIKRSEKGQIEIKFFDRFKALEKLSDDCETSENSTSFYDALMIGAKTLERETNGD